MDHKNLNSVPWFDLNNSRRFYRFNGFENTQHTNTYSDYYYMPYIPIQQRITHGVNLVSQRPQRMDPYLTSVFNTEQSLYDPPINDKLSLDKSVYASSPNSIIMYEQEKADMQSTLNNMAVSRNNSVVSDEFDLNSQYENSRDITKVTSSVNNDTSGIQNLTNSWPLNTTKSDIDFLNYDIFPMDQDIDNPTLAELNASESLLDDLTSIVENENKTWTNTTAPRQVSELPEQRSWTQTSSCGMIPVNKTTTIGRKPSATVTSEAENLTASVPQLHSLLRVQATLNNETETVSSPVQSVPNVKVVGMGKRKEVEEKWEEIKHYIYDEDKVKELPQLKQKRLSSDSYKSAITSNDDSDESERDSPMDSDSDYDDNSQDSWSFKQETETSQRKSRQYFWQYNLQSKGPKGARVNFEQLENDDPHVVKDFEDPVFDPVASKFVVGTTIRHGGKARRGDGTDVSPNPKKLYQIGQQINKLNKQIDSFIPLSEMPVSSRNKTKKEKNKLASRACRLKKKAQHEAYKIKLHGLDMEHKQLLQLTGEMKKKFTEILQKSSAEKTALKNGEKEDLKMVQFLENLVEKIYTYKVAGDTTEFVNRVICKVEEGDHTGGLDPTET